MKNHICLKSIETENRVCPCRKTSPELDNKVINLIIIGKFRMSKNLPVNLNFRRKTIRKFRHNKCVIIIWPSINTRKKIRFFRNVLFGISKLLRLGNFFILNCDVSGVVKRVDVLLQWQGISNPSIPRNSYAPLLENYQNRLFAKLSTFVYTKL